MEQLTLKYPGDAPTPVLILNRKEFLARHPRTPTLITDLAGNILEKIDIEPNSICCDYCNEDPLDKIYLVDDRRAYCERCFNIRLKRYCI